MGARHRVRRHRSLAPSPGGHLLGTPASRLSTKRSTQRALVYPSVEQYSSTAIIRASIFWLNPGSIVPLDVDMGPGFAEQREGRCTAFGTRVEYALAAVW